MVLTHTARALLLALLAALALLAPARPANAQPLSPTDGLGVIEAGRENELVGLVRPFTMTHEVTPGWVLGDIQVAPTDARYQLRGPAGATAALVLANPRRAQGASEHTASFAVLRELSTPPPVGANAALDALVSAVRRNDHGGFWPTAGPVERNAAPGTGRYRRLTESLGRVLSDGILLYVAALAFTLVVVRRQLREAPRWVAGALVAIVLVGALLRLWLAPETVMNASPYERVVPLARTAFDGVVLPGWSRLGHDVGLAATIHWSNYAIAAASPLVLFAHARFVLKDWRSALVAAGILAVLPMHIRFSRSDVQFVNSLATSSLTFVVLYGAMTDPSPRWRVANTVLLPFLCAATYMIRPENIVFYGLDLGAVLVASRGAPWGRRAAVFAVTTAAAAFAVRTYLLARFGQNVDRGLDWQTLRHAGMVLMSPRLNTLVNPWLNPPGLTVLAFVGGVTLWRTGERVRTVFLTTWLVTFFIVHSYVLPEHAAMQARYHMHLITPLVLLAAAATPRLLADPRRWLAPVVAVYLALSPLIHIDFERDRDFLEMHEYDFLRAARPRIHDGCTVLEFRAARTPARPASMGFFRFERVAQVLRAGRVLSPFTLVNLAVLPGPSRDPNAVEVPTEEALGLLEHQPSCLFYYEGLTCYAARPHGAALAPACEAVRSRVPLEPVASTTFAARIYDGVMAGRTLPLPSGDTLVDRRIANGERVRLTLYRVLAHRRQGQ